MARGPIVKTLNKSHIERLKAVQSRGDGRRGYSMPQLRMALDAPFTWETLQRAISGLPIQARNYAYIVQWLDRYVPQPPEGRAVVDGKARASGEREADDEVQEASEESGETTPAKPGTAGRLRDERIPREK